MKISADYRMLALDALRGKWKTAVLTGIAASALGATIVSSSNSVVSNSNQAKDIHFNLFAQPNGGRLLAVLLVGIGLFHCKCGTSWQRDIGFFERTPDMVFSLERKKVRNKVKQLPTIHHK